MNALMSARAVLGALVVFSAGLPAAAAAQPAASVSAFTRHVAELINDYRRQHGLGPLDIADELVALADEHSISMSQRRQLSHEGFRDRFQRSRSRVCVENVGWNHRTPEALFEGWKMSPLHHRNLLDPGVSRMGIASAARYVTFFACR